MNMTRHMFAGGLTPAGFIDFFDHIIPVENAVKRYFLKGASGSGKGTFIKKIAAEFEAAGLDIDFFHCANDSKSLDGAAIKSKGFCILDATTPHSHDPQIPAVTDEIIDFATFLDPKKVSKHKSEIIELTASKRRLFGQAQKFLSLAGHIYSQTTYDAALTRLRLQELAQEYMRIFENKPHCTGKDRKLFLSAITPDGIINFANSVLDKYNVYSICKDADANLFLPELKTYANTNGINTESFFCPLAPSKTVHLILPEEGVAFATSVGRFGYTGENTGKNICGTISAGTAFRATDSNEQLLNIALDSAINAMKAARDSHNKIEDIYINAMDFSRVDELADRMIANIRQNVI